MKAVLELASEFFIVDHLHPCSYFDVLFVFLAEKLCISKQMYTHTMINLHVLCSFYFILKASSTPQLFVTFAILARTYLQLLPFSITTFCRDSYWMQWIWHDIELQHQQKSKMFSRICQYQHNNKKLKKPLFMRIELNTEQLINLSAALDYYYYCNCFRCENLAHLIFQWSWIYKRGILSTYVAGSNSKQDNP